MSRFVRYCMLFLLIPPSVRAQTTAAPEKNEFSYLVRPSFTFLMSTEQGKDAEALVLSMYGQLRSQMSFDISPVHVKSYLNADFKREAYSDAAPRNLRDDLIVSVIPSVLVSEKFNVSLFLELTMETDMANKAKNVKLESGYSGLVSFEYSNDITENLSSFIRTFGIALSKGDLASFFENPHAVAEFEAGVTYKVFSFRYDLRIVYDPNYSMRRQLDQSASFGIQLEFKD